MPFLAVPVDPSADDARRWLVDELAKAPYQAAQPSWFDRLAQAFFDWLGSLAVPFTGGTGSLLWLLAVPVVVLVIVAIVVFGRPRRRHRGAGGDLFGEADARDAGQLRADAERAARGGDFAAAIADLFRAIARGLQERDLVDVFPGTTARALARAASDVLPAFADRLTAAAVLFDDVRYLDRAASADDYAGMAALERDLRAVRAERLDLEAEPVDTVDAGAR